MINRIGTSSLISLYCKAKIPKSHLKSLNQFVKLMSTTIPPEMHIRNDKVLDDQIKEGYSPRRIVNNIDTYNIELTKLDEIEQEYKKEIDEILSKYDENKRRSQEIIGVVVSTKASKTITVKYFHRKYFRKYNAHVSIRRKVMAHDEEEICSDGDLVSVIPCRPMSARKRHAIHHIIRKVQKLDVLDKPQAVSITSKNKKRSKKAKK